jgi:hypothetical protein
MSKRRRGSRRPLELGRAPEGVTAARGRRQAGECAGAEESFNLLLALLEGGDVGFVSRNFVWIVSRRGAEKIQRGRQPFR